MESKKTAYEIRLSLVGSEMCIRDRIKAETLVLVSCVTKAGKLILINI